ncbi:hypothetical protein Ddye_030635 [Dipteronia dyeriana]|uniref:Uncharacterized protein n=1 Tax=Dipteronia dyeriana TaxID=168575 RepID=A0AAD9THR0_9ROSI|nr:hypothetical protein Ddye_030635 [Dipteronia dyeriana]
MYIVHTYHVSQNIFQAQHPSLRFKLSPMDFHYTSQFDDVNEDDVLYAELRRQILLLTADNDEDCEDFVRKKRPNSIERNSNTSMSLSTTLQPGSYFNWWGNPKSDCVPTWLVNLWRNGNGNGNGTGVFIPRIVNTRRHKLAGQYSTILLVREYNSVIK